MRSPAARPIIALLLICSCQEPPAPVAINPDHTEGIPVQLETDSLLLPPDTIWLKDRPEPETTVVPRTAAEAAGKTVTLLAGMDTIQFTGQFPVLPPAVVPLQALQLKDGTVLRDSLGDPVILGDAGSVSPMHTFTTDDGLALDAISYSLLDRSGHLWIGTAGAGVSRFDGRSFTTYTMDQGLVGSLVYHMIQDRNGNLWFGCNGAGISRYDGKSFTNFTPREGLPSDQIVCLAEDRAGAIWIGTLGAGAARYDGSSFTYYTTEQGLPDNNILCMTLDRKGDLWLGTSSGLSRYDGRSFTNLKTGPGASSRAIYCIREDREGDLWLGSEMGISRYDGRSFVHYTDTQELAGGFVRCITEDGEGNIWFGTSQTGVARYDGRSFTNYTTRSGLASNSVICMTVDRSGNLWFGTDGGGMSRYDGHAFVSYTEKQGLPNTTVWASHEDASGRLWFATENGGVSCFDGRSFTNYSASQGLGNGRTYGITEDRSGHLWFSTLGSGVSRYDGRSFTNFNTRQGLVHNMARSLLEDRKGRLWIGTLGGVSRYDGKSFINYTKEQGLAGDYVQCMTEDREGNIWFGFLDGGVSRYDGRSFTNFTTAQGLLNNTVCGILEDPSGNILIATDGGISLLPRERTHRTGNQGDLFVAFTKADGLPDNAVTQFMVADSGLVYVGTNNGLCEFLPDPGTAKGYRVGRIFNSHTGYPVQDVNIGPGNIYPDRNGFFWIGTGSDRSGLLRFDPSALQSNSEPPLVTLQGLKVNGEPVCWELLPSAPREQTDSTARALAEFNAFGQVVPDDMLDEHLHKFGGLRFDSVAPWYPIPQNLSLPYRHNHVTIDYNAINPSHSRMMRYQYILEGYDHDWSPVTDLTSATFGNILEGTYTFKVKARSPEGIWGEPVTYTFRVLPPWYRTWWMYAIYLVAAVGAIRGYIVWRMRAVKRENLLLEGKVALRTQQLREENKRANEESRRANDLLLNILPEKVADELKDKGEAEAKLIDQVTVLFTDFAGFTSMSAKLSPKELVKDLHECFTAFDRIMQRHGLEKIKTIGDSYMAGGGLPVPNDTHAEDAVLAALEMRDFIAEGKARKIAAGLPWFEIRIGLHTGPVVAGIVGIKKFSYDIWGDTVNTASRMEQNSLPGKVNLSEATWQMVKDRFPCEYRGEIEVKGKGKMKMYFVEPGQA